VSEPPGLEFGGLRAFAQFIGWSRSGTTLIGSLLNAHPRVVIAQELDVASRVAAGVQRERLLGEIVESEAAFARGGRRWNGYSYALPGGSRRSAAGPLVLGDKKAAGTTEMLMRRPGILAETEALVGLPLRLVCVVRNPFDVVATLSRHLDTDLPSWHRPPPEPAIVSATDWYLRLAEAIDGILAERSGQFHVLHLERVIAEPWDELRRLYGFLGLGPVDEGLLDACAEIVFARPRTTRGRADWPLAAQNRLEAAIGRFAFLSPYRPTLAA
jgi:hypothetical protein